VRAQQVRRQRIGIHRKAMVLAGDQDLSGLQILDRVVGAVVAELHLHRPGAGRQRQQLVAQADTERSARRLARISRMA
jgi:hypothetical protein